MCIQTEMLYRLLILVNVLTLGPLAVGSAELLESSPNALSPQAIQRLQALAADFSARSSSSSTNPQNGVGRESNQHPQDEESVASVAEAMEEAFPGEEDDTKLFEEFTSRCQDIVARDGNLHIASVASVTRYFSSPFYACTSLLTGFCGFL